jgi:hypothetical protein
MGWWSVIPDRLGTGCLAPSRDARPIYPDGFDSAKAGLLVPARRRGDEPAGEPAMDGGLSDMASSPPPSRGTAQAGSKARLFEHGDVRVRAGPACAAATRKTARSRKDRAAVVPGRVGGPPRKHEFLGLLRRNESRGLRSAPLHGPAEGRNGTRTCLVRPGTGAPRDGRLRSAVPASNPEAGRDPGRPGRSP